MGFICKIFCERGTNKEENKSVLVKLPLGITQSDTKKEVIAKIIKLKIKYELMSDDVICINHEFDFAGHICKNCFIKFSRNKVIHIKISCDNAIYLKKLYDLKYGRKYGDLDFSTYALNQSIELSIRDQSLSFTIQNLELLEEI